MMMARSADDGAWLVKIGTIFRWNHKDPENAGLWEVLEKPQLDGGGLFTASFLSKRVDTGEEAYICPDASEMVLLAQDQLNAEDKADQSAPSTLDMPDREPPH